MIERLFVITIWLKSLLILRRRMSLVSLLKNIVVKTLDAQPTIFGAVGLLPTAPYSLTREIIISVKLWNYRDLKCQHIPLFTCGKYELATLENHVHAYLSHRNLFNDYLRKQITAK